MNRVEVGVVVAIVALLGFIVYSEVSWQNYAADHHCKRTGETREEMTMQYIYDGKGNITSSYPIYTTEYLYACDDGTRHWH